MSNEQIEKWLNDSAMAGREIGTVNEIRSDAAATDLFPENMIKTEDKNLISGKSAANRENDESLSLNSSTPEKNTIQATPTPPKITPTSERKTIFKKERSEPVRNVNAFSASNECSVYAFEADTEDSTSISTPFRRPCRRPSSTATSRSEDDAKIIDDISKHSTGKFRFPAVLRGDYKILNRQDSATGQPIQEDSTTQSTNLDVHTFTDTSNSEPPSIIEDISDQQIFCASTSSSTGQQQSNKNQSPPDIACAKVILGKTLPTGGNLHKTHSKLKAMHQQKKTMFPPALLHKGKNDDVRYKVPSSPSASSSSSAKLVNKRQTGKTRNRLPEAAYTQVVNVAEFPNPQAQQVRHQAQIVEAPCFHPTEKEFQDPLDYIEKIRARAEKFGICRIIPPANFKPECKVSDDMRFTAYNQYIGGMEIDLPRLYQTVQSLGGLKEVIEKKKWSKVSEAMKIPKSAQDRVTKLDDIYCKYLLPYDTLSPAEREKLFDEVETEWAKRESKTLLKVQRLSSGTDGDSDSDNESEECIVKGRNVALNAFYRIARNTMSMWFKTIEPSAEEVEQEFWKHVTLKNNHICVHSGSIDSGNWGYGFAVSKNSPFARHAWNLKVLTNNSGSVLRSMGPVMGVTVPTLHVGMVFSACCWYRDPHRLPWIEYLHTGAHKIWYGIPDSMSERFHASMLKLVPNYCRNKSIWLPSDTVMVPPKLLVENGVSLCRTVQEPGQFVVVFPKVFTSSVSTGYVVSESVYFAPSYWLKSAQNVFDELRKNCEPSMFSVDRLLLSITSDTRSSLQVLKQVMPAVQELCDREKRLREKLRELGLKLTEKLPPPEVPAVRKRRKLQQRQDNNGGDYECEICRANLFISLVNEYQEDVIYCLEHVIEYIEQKKIDVKNCKLLFTYGCEELDLLLEKLRNTIEAKQQKKAVTKAGPSTMQ
ncbi:lysine-specific demethylase [Holotrichia oblita]|uniref:Lysine-specific demethylase n=1 Tax=Holotrichia oblita TaxID=644536 RepID=A0ACB9TYN5_HOLOL|nr:lysine-specific demethylase [Holotrichia oblita]